MYLAILLLWVLHSLALHQALRRTSPTPALFGTALSILGLVLLAAGAEPHVATASLFDISQAAEATPQDPLGMAGLAAAVGVLAGAPDLGAVGVLILLAFHFCLGRKTLQLAHAPNPAMVAA